MNWRDEPVTEKQLQAIYNKSKGFKIDIKYKDPKQTAPKNKGEAFDIIEGLNKAIAEKKAQQLEFRANLLDPDFDDYPDNRLDWNEAQGGW